MSMCVFCHSPDANLNTQPVSGILKSQKKRVTYFKNSLQIEKLSSSHTHDYLMVNVYGGINKSCVLKNRRSKGEAPDTSLVNTSPSFVAKR